MTYIRPLGDTAIVGTAPGGGYTIGDFIGAVLNTAKGLSAATASDVPTASGGTSISSADFNSTAKPGVCKATNITALNYVKELQRQLNRVAQVKGFSKIAADGEIGPGSLALFAKVQGAAGSQVMGSPSSCMGVAPDADVLSAQVQGYADSLGAPAKASSAIALKAPTIIKPNGQEVAEAGMMAAFGQLPTLEQLAVVGVLGGIGYLLFTGKKRR
jgi:hypothetical protein